MIRIIVFTIICSGILYAQQIKNKNILTLDEVVRKALENNYELRLKRNDLRKVESELNEAGRLPNPKLNYSNEFLSERSFGKDNSVEVGEKSLTGTMPINFLWERWKNISSKKRKYEAEKNLELDQIRLTIYNTTKAYIELYGLSGLVSQYKSIKNEIDRITVTSKTRLEMGDISEYEHKRILFASAKLSAFQNESILQKQNKLNQLMLITGIDYSAQSRKLSGQDYEMENVSLQEFPSTDIDELYKTALDNRPDYKAALLAIESSEDAISYEKSRIIPVINLGFGYKKVASNIKGTILQIDFDIPLFNRNQKEIESAIIEQNKMNAGMFLLKNKIKTELCESLKKVELYKEQYNSVSRMVDKEMLSTAIFSYEKGETSLVEFIDALNAYTEGIKLQSETQMNYQISIYELKKNLGILGVKNEN